MGKIIWVCCNWLLLVFASLIFMGFLSGCSRELAIIEGSTEVLEEPFPKEYPGVSNKVIEVLQSGQEVEITGSQTGKDFKAYKMHLSDGRSGYIIAGGRFKVIKK
ncbi:MAG: hypothetical protein MPW16_14115 [Candidatus Manganitrophus sp.]|nr:MAG: hypothetical protein MPW16_14115 [Candidatus Manganitrophus sp.]